MRRGYCEDAVSVVRLRYQARPYPLVHKTMAVQSDAIDRVRVQVIVKGLSGLGRCFDCFFFTKPFRFL